MMPFKVQFEYNGVLKSSLEKSKTCQFINKCILNASKEKHPKGMTYMEYAKSIFLPDVKSFIEKSLIEENSFVKFNNASYQIFDITDIRSVDTKFSWQTTYILKSETYNCIHIMEDKTMICYTNSEKELVYINPSKYKMKSIILD